MASLAAGESINEVAERFGVQPSLLSTLRRKYEAAVAASKSTTKTAQFTAVRVKEAATDGVIEIDQAKGSPCSSGGSHGS
jgi:transposase-like protein